MSNDNENFGLLYSAYHKFYSALKHLNQFCVGNDLFDNISSLDSFFSEYRNITFVLQKSLNKTEYMDDYKSIRDKHFSDPVSKWMVLSRNKVLKQQPFELKKKVIVTIYLPTNSLEFFVQEFTLSNEEEYSVLNHKIMTMIADLKLLEVHFSIEYLFYKEHSQELFEDITVSIINAFNFLQEMEDRILHAKNEFASFYMLSKQEEGIVRCSFDLKRILDKEYIFKQIRQLEWQKEEIKNSFLNPIIRALDDIRSGQ